MPAAAQPEKSESPGYTNKAKRENKKNEPGSLLNGGDPDSSQEGAEGENPNPSVGREEGGFV